MKIGIYLFIKDGYSIKALWSGIGDYLQSRINIGIIESINSKIQLAQTRV
ncbi:MAG: hypothetical protein KDC31_11340 [Saprospiraceae bacterium]|nr:hypothetical protein [Saprospiraceae bacterium]MCB0591878.1 hypothetical protein [Saprospiraceae bacterium]MCO6469615.1 hypothetical protein [Saprospiraceae bacterium]